MKNKTKFITVLSTVMLIVLCLLFLVRHASHSTAESVRRRAVMAYYHTIGRSVIKSGGKLNITNGGIINSRENKPFVISKGARLKISNGKIK